MLILILIGVIILLIFGIMYKIIKNLNPTDIIPVRSVTSETEAKRKQIYDNIINKFIYPNQTTSTVTNNNNNYSVWNKITTTSNINM